jgi:hypothetical protein
MSRHVLTAIRSGTDPIAALPPASFHRTLEDPIYCPKCEATYFLVVDFDWATSRHFAEESRRHLSMLRKSIFQGHADDHRSTHFETNGVVVTSHVKPRPEPTPSLDSLTPLSRLIN